MVVAYCAKKKGMVSSGEDMGKVNLVRVWVS